MPRCKHCKESFEKTLHFNQKFCLKEECKKQWYIWAKQYAKKKEDKKLKDEVKKLKKKWFPQDQETIQKLMSKAQYYFNRWVRERDKGQNCISCGKPPRKKNAGHYHSANNYRGIRFDPLNVHLQCEPCNNNLSGNTIEYRKGLIKKIGLKKVKELEERAHVKKEWTREELKEIVEKYKKKYKELRNEL